MNIFSSIHWNLGLAIWARCPLVGARTADVYVPLTLDQTIEQLGLRPALAHIRELELAIPAPSRRCEKACDILATVLPSEVQFPGSEDYNSTRASYWAQQQSDLSPSCFVVAKRSHSVSTSITVSRKTKCPFSVRSGGHSDVPGASNIEKGITIDLRSISEIDVSDDKRITYVGAGARWGEVYAKLDEMDLMVVGGRVFSLGVGGLTLGGGISFFSGKEGLACDNVVVMADGRLRDVNQTSYPDLYRALRGGGNNFGIVTRFDLDTYPQGEMWSAIRTYPLDAKEHLIEGLASFNKNAADDSDLAIITSFAYAGGQWICGHITDYARPVPDPELFISSFGILANIPPIRDNTQLIRLSNLSIEMIAVNPPSGLRDRYATATYKNSIELQNRIVDIVVSELDRVKGEISNLEGFVCAVNFQAITLPMISKFSKRGGNILGISPDDGPLLLILINFTWASSSDDDIIISASESILSQSNGAAAELGLINDFVYMNYAGSHQSPFVGYGKKNLQQLRKVQAKYDPNLVFEKLQPGWFKLR
ncbi:uncharacterized protein PADG_06231 [Paracoccidioides brasiliensis Pb18]|uniref:FAD-binding PCMH-type domain-containing protein n=1 Tax=Paracoccidioides brasiliensis (strain Pb18) TaxID=502780 RepID=C1GFZ4_PARBD|nr:uncharacterized protein PADG_06231 [Paracoccidioides brasiliensis Pb18]EEH50152.2 hypothetical protein PADG_06231 [Paracoccidioides brasiliensis Pb18]